MRDIVVLCININKIKDYLVKEYNSCRILFLSSIKYSEIEKNKFIKSFQYCKLFDNLNFHDEKYIFDIISDNTSNIQAIVTYDEYALLLGAKCREEFNIPGDSYEYNLKFRDKLIMKKIANNGSLLCPNYAAFNKETSKEFLNKYNKIVIKRTLGMGSRDMYIIDNENSLDKAINLLDSHRKYMVEEFISGDVFHIDAVIIDSSIKCINVMKYISNQYEFDSNLFAGSSSVTDNKLFLQCEEFAKKCVNAFKIKNDVIHLEVILHQNELYFCEVACRAGGGGIVSCFKQIFNIDLNIVDAMFQLNDKNIEIEEMKKRKKLLWILFYPKIGNIKTNFKNIDGLDVFSIKYLNDYTKVEEPANCADGVLQICYEVNTNKNTEELINEIIQSVKE